MHQWQVGEDSVCLYAVFLIGPLVRELKMSASLTQDLQQLPLDQLQLARCQVDVSFPPGYKTRSQPHCPWYTQCNGRPQIIEVKDTGWETYHFPTINDAQRFVDLTQRNIAAGSFAGGRMPPGEQVSIQLRAAVDIERNVVVSTTA
jgi:hypothetical protein